METMTAKYRIECMRKKWFFNWKFTFLHRMIIIEKATLLSVSPLLEDVNLKFEESLQILPPVKMTF